MTFLSSMLELCALLFVCLLIGRQLIRFLPKEMQDTVGFYLAPLLGMATLMLFATLYGWFLPFSFAYSLSATLGFALLAFVFEQQKAQWVLDGLQLSCFALLCALPVLAPIIFYGGYNPFTDTFTYLAQGQWLQTHAFSEKAVGTGYYPAMTQVVIYQRAGSRMGGTFLLSYIQSLFNFKWSYYAYIPTMALAFVTGSLALGGIIRQVVAVRRLVILALCLLPAFSMNGYVFGAEWGFFPQTFGLAFAAGLAALLPLLVAGTVRDLPSVTRTALQLIPLAICTAALLYAYNEPFVIFGAGIFLFFAVTLFCYKNQIKNLLAFLSLYVIEVALLLNYEGIRIVKNFFQTLSISKEQAAIGWPVLWSPVQFFAHAFGMKSAFKNGQFAIDYLTSVYLFLPFFILLCIGIYHYVYKKQKNRLTLLFLICADAAFLLAFIKFRYFSANMSAEEVGFTFLQFKVAKYAAPFSLALVGIFFAALWINIKKLRPAFTVVYLLAITIGLFIQCKIITPHFVNNFLSEVEQKKSPFNVLLQLREAAADIPKDHTIYLAVGEEHSKLRQMLAYILYDHKVASDYRDDGYIVGSLPQEERNMPLTAANWLIVMKPKMKDCEYKSQIVGPFMIQQVPFNYVSLDKMEGGFATEWNESGDSWNWVNNAIDYHFTRVGKATPVKFKFKLQSFSQPRTFLLELKDASGSALAKYKFTQAGEKLFESPWLKTKSAHLILHVSADGQPVRISKGDSREVKFVIANTGLCTK